MKNSIVKFLLPLLVLIALNDLNAKEPLDRVTSNSKRDLSKTNLRGWKYFDGNQIKANINASGPYCDYLQTNSSGLFWPKGSNKTAVYTAGIWMIGFHRPTGRLRTAVQDYSTEFQPGPIISTFNTTTNSTAALGDPDAQKHRLYKINRVDERNVGTVKANPDYDEWPGDLGAPYIDVNNNGVWDKGTDKPRFWGDQQIWVVYNDGNASNHKGTGTTNPMGVEVQTTYFGFDQPGALGNIMFMRWKVINKSDADYDSMFISMWSDTDLGYSDDDVAACDTIRKLAYVFNGDNFDETGVGYGDKPPANGFVFFQGPKVAGLSTDTALFEGKKIPGFRNLPSSSHVVYFNSNPIYSDPPLGNVLFPEQAYNYMNGLIGKTGQPFLDHNGKPSKFVFPGDPVTKSGWTQEASAILPGDARSMITAGPFTFAKGDTQEIVGGFVIAQGSDALNSIIVLRRFVDVAQESFDVNFALASPPPQPDVTVGEYDKRIVLHWGDPSKYKETEYYNYKGTAKDYRFEGYNVYQISDKGSNPTIVKLATYDSVDNVKMVLDYQSDPITGQIIPYASAFGEDSGVKRSIVIDKDVIRNAELINGKEYYFAVTSYAYNFDPNGAASGIVNVLENSKSIITVVPHGINVGDKFAATQGAVVKSNRSINGDDAFRPTVLNPRELTTGATYEVTFNGSGLNVTSWNLKRKNFGPDTTLLTNIPWMKADPSSPIVDGIQFLLENPVAGPRRDTQNPKGYAYTPAANLWFKDQNGVTMDAFRTVQATALSGAIAYPTVNTFTYKTSKLPANEVKKVEIRFSATNTSKAYRYLDKVRQIPFTQPADPAFVPFIKTRGAGYQYQDTVQIPLQVWEIDSLDGSYAPRRLNVGFLEVNDTLIDKNGVYLGRGNVDGQWMPTRGTTGGGEVLYIFGSTYSDSIDTRYTKRPGSTTVNLDIFANQDSIDIMYVLWVKADSGKTFTNGDKFTITPNYPFTASSSYSMVAPKNTVGSAALVKENIERINVFPNPYFGNNKAETNVYQRFVTFSNLPNVAIIRMFNIAGELVSTIRHNNTTGSERWDLRNSSGLPVASGIYIAHIEIPNAGEKILKVAIVAPEERPTR